MNSYFYLVEKLKSYVDTLKQLVEGDSSTVVIVNGVERKSIAKELSDSLDGVVRSVTDPAGTFFFETIEQAKNDNRIEGLTSSRVYIREREAFFYIVRTSSVSLSSPLIIQSNHNADYCFKIEDKPAYSPKNMGASTDLNDNESYLNNIFESSTNAQKHDVYYIKKTVNTVPGLFEGKSFLVKSASEFEGDELISIDSSALPSYSFGVDMHLNVRGDGEGNYLGFDEDKEPTITGVRITGDRTTANKYFINATYCHYGLMLYGEVERKGVIELNATSCNIAFGAVLDGFSSADECRVLVNAAYCKHWYYSSGGEESQHITFNVENNLELEVYDPNHFVVDYQGGKSITIAGEIRGTKGNCIGARRESGSWGDAIHFDNLAVIQVDEGIALYVEHMTRMKGIVNLYDCTNSNGPTVHLNDCIESQNLQVTIDKCFSLCGLKLTAMENTRINASIYMGDIYSTDAKDLTALCVESAANCSIHLGDSKGNLDLSGASGCTIYIDKSFVDQGFTISGGSTSVVKIGGSLGLTDVQSISWLNEVASVEIENFELTGTPYYYYDGAWITTSPLSGSNVEIGKVSSFTNTVFKKTGISFFNTDDKKSYVATGSAPADEWVSVDGKSSITPIEMDETQAYVDRLSSPPSVTERAAYDRLLYRLISAGINSEKMDYMYLLAQKSQANAFVDLFSKAANLTKAGNLNFIANLGFSNPTTDPNAYLEAPNISSTRSVTNLTVGAYGEDHNTNPERDIEDVGSAVYLRLRAISGGYINFGSESSTLNISGLMPKLIQGTRFGNKQSIYSNGVKQRTTNVYTVNEWQYGLRLIKTDRTTRIFYCGAAFTDKQSKLASQAVNEYLTTIS